MSRVDERWESAQAAVEADVREAGPAGPLSTATTMVEVLARRQAVRWAEERWQGLAPVRLLGPRREGAVAGSGTVVVEGQVDARWAARGGAGGTYEGLAGTGGRYVLVTPTEPRVAPGRLWLETRGLGAYRSGLLVVDGPEGAEVVEVADVEVTRVRGMSVAEVTLSRPLRVTPSRLRMPTAQASLIGWEESREGPFGRMTLDTLHRAIKSGDVLVLDRGVSRLGGGDALVHSIVTVLGVQEREATPTTPPRTILTVDFVPGADTADA
ncbi:MAG: hypothetical protein KF901_27935, partial [Myxococcales bacterium]|nr:hypothetical protein [Myxococcales bacterium]